MDKSELKAEVARDLENGTDRSVVFTRLAGQGANENLLATLIAGHATPDLRSQHRGKVRALIGLMLVQAAVVLLLQLALGARYGAAAQWLLALAFAAFPLLFAWGFHKHVAGAYAAYMVVSISQLPRQLEGLLANPQGGAVGLGLSIALLAYVWHVRRLLFPDFGLLGPRKLNGHYVFSA